MSDLTKELVIDYDLAGYQLKVSALIPTQNSGFSLEDGDLMYLASYSSDVLYKKEVVNEAQAGDYVEVEFTEDTPLSAAPDPADYTFKFLIVRDGSTTYYLTAEYVDLFTADDMTNYVVRAVSGATWTAA